MIELRVYFKSHLTTSPDAGNEDGDVLDNPNNDDRNIER